jgi:hypothetical protein
MDRRNGGEVDWPHGSAEDPSAAPLLFNPKGFLVAILPDASSAEDARASLESSGFPASDLRVYLSEEIVQEHERYLTERGLARTIITRITERESDYAFYSGLASDGCAALWVHVSDRHDASRAIRHIADHQPVYYRYFGWGEEIEIPVGLP